MRSFEHLAEGESYARSTFIQPFREPLWTAAFGVESLTGLFDMTPAADALPILDAAIAAFNQRPEELRPLVSSEDIVGLRGNRNLLLDMRAKLARLGGTISGAVDESPDPA